MTLAWLGRRGGGGFCSSDSLRGSLMLSVMAILQAGIMTQADSDSTIALATVNTPRSVSVFGSVVTEHDVNAARNLE